jgi:competence protein ComEA
MECDRLRRSGITTADGARHSWCMPSAADRRAALLLVGLAGLGLGVRLVVGGLPAPGAVAYRFGGDGRPARDSVARDAARFARPLAAGERVDVDRASAAELDRLPRIGPALAARIVADREAHGPFGSLEGLRRVPGVGAAAAKALAPFVTFSRRPAAPAMMGRGARTSEPARVAVNRADVEELATLPGIGPRLAAAIVEERRRHGPFRSADDLRRVRGIGPALVTRLTGRIRVP